MSTRKPYNCCAGYIASRRNDINRGWVVIYDARKQHLDETDGRYAVVCETHHVLVNVTSMLKARLLLKFPGFCEACMSGVRIQSERDFAALRLTETQAFYNSLPANASSFERTRRWADVTYWQEQVAKQGA